MTEPKDKVQLQLTIYRNGKPAAAMRFDSVTAIVEIEGTLYPADLATANALIQVLREQKDRWHPAKSEQ